MKKPLVQLLAALLLTGTLVSCTPVHPIDPVDTSDISDTSDTIDTTDTADTSEITPVETDPVETDPVETDPVETDPVETDPIETDPVETDPIETDPVETDPIETDPVETDPVETEPLETDPVETDPIETDPVETDPVEIEPVETEPVETERKDPYTEILLYSSARKPLIDGTIMPGEYGVWYDAAYTRGNNAPQTRYYLGWSDEDLYFAVRMKIDVSKMTDEEKETLLNRINIETQIYRGDYRARVKGDPGFTTITTENSGRSYRFRYKDASGTWNSHGTGSARLVCSVVPGEPEGYYTVMIEHKFNIADSVIPPTSSTADGVYTIGSVVSFTEDVDTVSESYMAPSAHSYKMGYYVAATSIRKSDQEEPDNPFGDLQDEDTSYLESFTTKFDGYTVTLSEPIVVFQGKEGDDAWGHVNFPKVGRTAEGYLRVWWTYGEDKTGATGNVTYARVSEDEGKTWGKLTTKDKVSEAPSDMLMKNGKCFGGFSPAGEPTNDELAELIPDSEKVKLNGGSSLILTEDLEKYDRAQKLNLIDVSMKEYDPVTGRTTTVTCTVNWPYKAVTMTADNVFISPARWFSMASGSVVLASDGALYVGVYALGFDADAPTFADSITSYTKSGKSYVYIFKSTDCGRTWDYLAQFCAPAANSDGFTEPDLIEMADGSLFVLMRSGHTSPTYSAVSHDGGLTWTEPEQFDVCGVRPQLLGLDCGVTLATYGRPYQFVRTTADPTGTVWDEHIEIPLANTDVGFMNQSCFNNRLLEIDENSAWLCYTDFQFPNENGWGVKSVILRKITVTMDEST